MRVRRDTIVLLMRFTFQLNQRGEFSSCTPACTRLFGAESEHALGRRLDRFVAWESGTVLLQALLDVYKGRTVKRAPLRIITTNRRKFHALLSLKPILTDEQAQVLKVDGVLECT